MDKKIKPTILVVTKLKEISLILRKIGCNPIMMSDVSSLNKILEKKDFDMVIIGPPFSNKDHNIKHKNLAIINEPHEMQTIAEKIIKEFFKEEQENFSQDSTNYLTQIQKDKNYNNNSHSDLKTENTISSKEFKKKFEVQYSELEGKVVIVSHDVEVFREFSAINPFMATNLFSLKRILVREPNIKILVSNIPMPKKMSGELKEKGIKIYSYSTDILNLQDLWINYKTSIAFNS